MTMTEEPVQPLKAGLISAPFSLRTRFSLLGLLVLALLLGGVGMALQRAHSNSAVSELQAQMETWVYLALGALDVTEQGQITVPEGLGDPRLTQPGSGVYIQVRDATSSWLSPSALGQEPPDFASLSPGEKRFRDGGAQGQYVFYQYGVAWELADSRLLPFTVTVWVERRLLEERIRSFRDGLWWSLLGVGVALGIAQFIFLWLALSPLRKVASDVAAIESGRREQLTGRYPLELEPLIRNVNHLLTSEKSNQRRYRMALDSLAHGLKTPLSVVRAGLEKTSGPETESMRSAAEDMQRMITHRLQRAAIAARRTHTAPIAILPLVERLAETVRKVYSQDLRILDVRIAPTLKCPCGERDLMEIIGNLLENACKYGGGCVGVSAGTNSEHVWLKIENDGAPIDASEAQHWMVRGKRGDEVGEIEGHGLGLTIVTELISAYGGDLNIGVSELGGAAITIRFPVASHYGNES